MKTLDEVIEALDICWHVGNIDCTLCPYYTDNSWCDEKDADVIYYLQEYRDKRHELDIQIANYQEAVKNCELAENRYKREERITKSIQEDYIREINDGNQPLIWEELKTMIGKPVWILESLVDPFSEDLLSRKGHWDIIREIYHDEQMSLYVRGMTFHKSWMGVGWNAFRRETK